MRAAEIAAELAESGARELLAIPAPAHLSYVGRDGTPRVVPIGFLWKNDLVVMSTAWTAPKVRAIQAHPDVALSIDEGGTSGTARAVLIRGRATVEQVNGVPDEYLEASRKGLDADAAAEFESSVRSLYDWMARITLEPTWARFYDFGAGRLPRTLQELAARQSD